MSQLGEAEVEDLDPAVPRDEEVLGFQVAVDDSLLVRGREPMRDLRGIFEGFALRGLSAGENGAQRLAFEKLLDDVGRSVALIRPDVVDGGDVGVIQDSGGFGLLLEAAQTVRVGRERRGQNLDRDLAGEPRVARSVHLAHSPGSQRGKDLVGTEAATDGERHRAFASASVRIQMSALLLERTV